MYTVRNTRTNEVIAVYRSAAPAGVKADALNKDHGIDIYVVRFDDVEMLRN